MKIVPVGDHVVVRNFEPREPEPEKLKLPDGACREGAREGRVLSVGDGRMLPCGDRVDPRVVEGDRVLYSTSAGTEVTIGGQPLVILNEDEILAVLP
jgi:chaperonin GroES